MLTTKHWAPTGKIADSPYTVHDFDIYQWGGAEILHVKDHETAVALATALSELWCKDYEGTEPRERYTEKTKSATILRFCPDAVQQETYGVWYAGDERTYAVDGLGPATLRVLARIQSEAGLPLSESELGRIRALEVGESTVVTPLGYTVTRTV